MKDSPSPKMPRQSGSNAATPRLRLFTHDLRQIATITGVVHLAELRASEQLTEVWRRDHGKRNELIGYRRLFPSAPPSNSRETPAEISASDTHTYAAAVVDIKKEPLEKWELRIMHRVMDRLVSRPSWVDRVVTA